MVGFEVVKQNLARIDLNLIEQSQYKYHSEEYNKIQEENERLISEAKLIIIGQV
jgi:hypothetical protein